MVNCNSDDPLPLERRPGDGASSVFFRSIFVLLIIVASFAIFFLFSPVSRAASSAESVDLQVCPLRADFLAFSEGQSPKVAFGRECNAQKIDILEEQLAFERGLREIVVGYPIEEMISSIARFDPTTAAFLIGIAKKESQWGKRRPSKDGIDCYNYWGIKGSGARGVGMGHACFATPEEAVERVGSRISELVHEHGRSTPSKMIVWKCGSSCAGHSPESVSKWISDVSRYYDEVLSIVDDVDSRVIALK
ncbi:MAG: glucosaminidase domain-containing protein [Candidatus Moranbacteria bacterium]|nr:glucosaminidase domain-containing protein [Candidatus Moranbacteria bacterium]